MLRSVQGPIKNVKGAIKISIVMLVVVVKQNMELIETYFLILTSVVMCHKSAVRCPSHFVGVRVTSLSRQS